MDIGKSFSYVFEDPNWISKVAIGGAILLAGTIFAFLLGLPLLAASIILLGYSLTVIKNVAEGNPTPLPQWNDFGAFFMKGLYAGVGIIVLELPAIILGCCLAAVTTAVNGQSANGNSAGPMVLVATCLQCLIAIYSIIVGLYVYAPMTRYALNGQLSTFWDFSGNFAFIQANLGNYVIALIMTIVASIIGSLGFALCVIPGFFTAFWAQLVGAHLFGQFARTLPGTAGPAPAAPMAPPPVSPAPMQ